MSHFMPTNTAVFLLGLAVGSMLLILGLGLGYWLGRKAGAAFAPVQGQQFLAFLRSMSQLTSEFSGDVLKYQNRLSSINERVQAGGAAGRDAQHGSRHDGGQSAIAIPPGKQ